MLERARLKKGVSTAALARAIGEKQPTVYFVLNEGQRTCEFLPKLCKELDVHIAWTTPLEDWECEAIELLAKLRRIDREEIQGVLRDIKIRMEGISALKEKGIKLPPRKG